MRMSKSVAGGTKGDSKRGVKTKQVIQWNKGIKYLQSNLLPLCLASFMRLVSLVISGMTLFNLAASLWPFTMTGNTAQRAMIVPTHDMQQDPNSQQCFCSNYCDVMIIIYYTAI